MSFSRPLVLWINLGHPTSHEDPRTAEDDRPDRGHRTSRQPGLWQPGLWQPGLWQPGLWQRWANQPAVAEYTAPRRSGWSLTTRRLRARLHP